MKLLIGMAISLALVAWLVLNTDWSLVADELAKFQPGALIPIALVFGAHYFLRAWRWRFLLPPTDSPPSLRRLTDSLMVGNLATYLLPMRAGEFIRPLFLLRHSSYTFSSAFVSIVVERFFDLAVVLISFAFVVRSIAGFPEWAEHGAMLLSIVAVAIFFGIVIASFAPHLVFRSVEYFSRYLPEKVREFAKKMTKDFIEGAAVLSRPRNLLYVITLSALVWGSCFLLFSTFFWMFGESVPFIVSVTLTVVIALAVAAPSAPGFLGVYQTACVAAFAIFGMKAELAVAYSIVTHLIHYAVFIIYGFWVLSREKLSLRDLRAKKV